MVKRLTSRQKLFCEDATPRRLGLAVAMPYVCRAMKPKAEIKRLLEAARRAEAELEAATTLSELKPVAKG
jgi:hypothetical protein